MTRSYNKNKKKKTTPLASRRLRVVLFVFFCDLLVPRVYGDANCSVPTTCQGGVTCDNCGECPDGEGSACRCDPHWTGNQCHIEVENIEDCVGSNHYCLNNGQCNTGGLASCTCKRNYFSAWEENENRRFFSLFHCTFPAPAFRLFSHHVPLDLRSRARAS